MGVVTKKYGVSVRFCRRMAIFAKIVGQHPWIEPKFQNCKTRKNHIWNHYV
jgi:hypothetical protein